VTQKRLDFTNVRTVLEQVGREAVAQRMQRHALLDPGCAKAKPTGGSTSPLEAHAEELLALIAEQPDLSLDEVVVAMRKRRIRGSRTAVWRFFARRGFTFKKKPARRGTTTAGRGLRTPTLAARAVHVRPGPAGIHRRNRHQHQHGEAEGPLPAR